MPTPATGPPSASAALATVVTASAITVASNSTSPGAGEAGRTARWSGAGRGGGALGPLSDRVARWPRAPPTCRHRRRGRCPLRCSCPGGGPEGRGEAELPRVEDPDRVEALFEAGEDVESRTEGARQEAGPVEPDAVMMADGRAVGQGGVGHDIPGLPVVALPPVGVALRSPPGKGEVEAGAVRVGVRLMGRGGQRPVD